MKIFAITMITIGVLLTAIILILFSWNSYYAIWGGCAHDCGITGTWFLAGLGISLLLLIIPAILILTGALIVKKINKEKINGQYKSNNPN